MYRLSGLFLCLTFGTTFWLVNELGLLSYTPAGAAMGSPPGEARWGWAVGTKSSTKGASGMESLEQALVRREKGLDDREAALVARERVLADKEAQLTRQMEQYEKFVDTLQKKIANLEHQLELKTAENDSVSAKKAESMRQVYERMDAKQAARILNTMEIGLAGQLLGGMKRDKAAEIMEKLPPERAKLVTEQILARKSSSTHIASAEK